MTFNLQSWHLAEQEIIMEHLFYSLACQWRSALIRVLPHHQSAEAFVAFQRWNARFSQCDWAGIQTQFSSFFYTLTCSLIHFQLIFMDFPFFQLWNGLLNVQICMWSASADESTSVRPNRTLKPEAGCFFSRQPFPCCGPPSPFRFCFCQVIQSPFKPLRLRLSAVVFVRENCVCQRPPLPSWTQLNRRRKLSQEDLKIHSSLQLFFHLLFSTGCNKGYASLLQKTHTEVNQPGTSLNASIDFKE